MKKILLLMFVLIILSSFAYAEIITDSHGVTLNDFITNQLQENGVAFCANFDNTRILNVIDHTANTNPLIRIRNESDDKLLGDYTVVGDNATIGNLTMNAGECYIFLAWNSGNEYNYQRKNGGAGLPISGTNGNWTFGYQGTAGSWFIDAGWIFAILSITSEIILTTNTPAYQPPTPANNAFNNTNQTINCTTADPTTNLRFFLNVSLSGGFTDAPYLFNVTPTGEGHRIFETNFSDGTFTYDCFIQNITNGLFSNEVSRTLTIDTVKPTITILTNNNWKIDNTTIISPHIQNLTINISFTDDSNLFQTLINFTFDENGTSFYSRHNTSITGTEDNFSITLDLGTFPIGNYTLKLVGSDPHTLTSISDYDIKKGLFNDYLEYKTEEGITIRIETLESILEIRSVSTTKQQDRYSFKWVFWNEKTTTTFRVTSSHPLQYVQSDYNAHLVTLNGMKGNWIDFNSLGLKSNNYEVTRVNDYTYDITIKDMNMKEFEFNSIGGLNIQEEHYKIQLGAVIDIWVFDEENYPNQINATATIGTQSNTSIINTSPATLINITKDITSVNLTSVGFGEEIKSISITENYHNFSFNMSPVLSTKIFFFDEKSETLIESETFSVFLEKTGFSNTFTGITDNPHTLTGLEEGLYKLKASSTNYAERQYLDLNISNVTTTFLNVYLINNTIGSEVLFNIVSVDGLAPLENVRTVFTKIINGTSTVVSEEDSDFAGQIVLTLDPDTQYTINFSRTGFEDKTILLEPKNSVYLIQMVSTVGAYNQSVYEGIRYRFEPVNTVLNNNTKYNFTFTLNSTVWPLTNCTLKLFNGTILLSQTSSFTSSSCFIRIELNTSDMTNILSEATYELDSQFEFVVSQQYKVIFTYIGEFSLKSFLDDLSDFGMAGFDDFGRMILALIVIFIITVIAAREIGFANQEVLILLVIAQVWLFSSVNWLFLNFTPIPTIAGFDLKKYIIAILVTMAGGAFLIEKFTKT